MPNKLYFFSNLKGVKGWAACAESFRDEYAPYSLSVVRVAHKGIEPPEGYEKTGDRANNAAVKIKQAKQQTRPVARNFGEIL